MFIRSLFALATAATLVSAAAPSLAQDIAPAGAHGWGGANADRGVQMATNRFFDKLDPDRTGKISRATYLADAKKTFDAIDIDKTGKLTKSEIALWEARHHARGGMRGHMFGMHHAPGMAWRGGPGPSGPKPSASPSATTATRSQGPRQPHGMFAAIPRDASGSITLEAYMKWAGERFDAIDIGHSGTITVPLYRAYVKAQMAKRPQPTHLRRPLSAPAASPAPAT